MCTENKIPEKPFDFFSFLQVALSLEDHSSEVQVVKHLLHILSHPPPTLPHFICRPGVVLKSTPNTYALKCRDYTWESGGFARYKRWSR